MNDTERIGGAFWRSVDEATLFIEVAREHPMEEGEARFDYAERLGVEAGKIPLLGKLRERNALRYADRIKALKAAGLGDFVSTLPAQVRPTPNPDVSEALGKHGLRGESSVIAEYEERGPAGRHDPPVPKGKAESRQLPHEHDFFDGVCECGARAPMRLARSGDEPGAVVTNDDDETPFV